MKFPTYFLLAIAFAVTVMDSRSDAVTIRDDRDDAQYTNLAATEHPAAGLILGSNWLGSGTLISPNWVLTATHVLEDNMTFNTSAGSVNIVQRIVNPSYDIALARLETPVTTIAPMKLYSLDYGVEDFQAARIAGVGNKGTGSTGQIDFTGGTSRVAESAVYANASYWGWDSELLLTYFRPPELGAANLEGGSTQGDSGGGIFLNVNGEWSIAGVMTQTWAGAGDTIGMYNTGGVFVRSATVNDWILANATDAQIVGLSVPEPASFALMLVAMGCLGLRQPRRMK